MGRPSRIEVHVERERGQLVATVWGSALRTERHGLPCIASNRLPKARITDGGEPVGSFQPQPGTQRVMPGAADLGAGRVGTH